MTGRLAGLGFVSSFGVAGKAIEGSSRGVRSRLGNVVPGRGKLLKIYDKMLTFEICIK